MPTPIPSEKDRRCRRCKDYFTPTNSTRLACPTCRAFLLLEAAGFKVGIKDTGGVRTIVVVS